MSEAKAIKLMLAQPSMIKRPVLELDGGKLLVGFKPEAYAAACGVGRKEEEGAGKRERREGLSRCYFLPASSTLAF